VRHQEIHVHTYPIHTIESAPEKSKQALAGLKQAIGVVPNLAATMAASPPLVNSFVGTFGHFHGGSFTGAEKQTLLLSNAVANRSAWAVAFHSTLALREGVAEGDVQAIRAGKLPGDPRLAALSALTRALIDRRGHLDERDVQAFVGAGFAHEQVLEVIAGLAASVMANYTGNVTRPPVEEPFRAHAWTP
jgi:alkylhydroperoxidase family enzyme